MRAAIGSLVSPERRGTAFGLLNASYGPTWFLGSMAMGSLYDISLPALIVFSVITQLAAVTLFLWIGKRT